MRPITMPHFLAAAMLILLPAMTTNAQVSQESLYIITLTAVAAVDEPDVVAAQIAAASGGTVENVTDGTVTMRLTPSRVRVVSADPRVGSVAPMTGGAMSGRVTTAAETMTWSSGVAYDYDDSGNVRQIGTDTFVYDTVGRLVQSHTNGIPRNYEYDAFGNRKTCRQSEDTPTEGDCQYGYTINSANNRLNNTTYDAAGNVTGFGTHVYTYDALNMQTRDASGSLAREYIYTADDERIAIYEVGQRWRWTVRDTSGKVLREFTSTNAANGSLGTANWQWTKDYVWRGGLLLASRQMEGGTPTTYHYHLDHLGTPRRITDAADRIVGVHDYFPFGPEQTGGQNEPSLSLMKFTGHERDIVGYESWDTLDYMHARFSNPTLGRFLSVDPVQTKTVATPQLWNKYVYANNRPLNLVDPDGKCAVPSGLQEGLVGICIESFIAASRINLIGFGDDRDFESNDPNATFRTSYRMVMNPRTGKILNEWVDAGVSKVGGLFPLVGRKGTTHVTGGAVFGGHGTALALHISGDNGLNMFNAFGTIGLAVSLNIGPAGTVTVNPAGSATKAYPSIEGYAYTIVDSQLVIKTLFQTREQEIDALKGGLTAPLVGPSDDCYMSAGCQ